VLIPSKSQGKEKHPSGCRVDYCTLALRDLSQNKSALPVVGRASYCLAGERLLVRDFRLEAVSDAEIPLD